MLKIVVSSGWVNTPDEFVERECASLADALENCPEFFDRARGEMSGANARLFVGATFGEEINTSQMHSFDWWEARMLFRAATGEADVARENGASLTRAWSGG